MRTFQKQINSDVVEAIERAAFEMNARQQVVDRYLDRHASDGDSSALDSPVFLHFMSLLAESETEFELLKDAIGKEEVGEELNQHDAEWTLDYATQTITYTLKCDCPIDDLNGFVEVKTEE